MTFIGGTVTRKSAQGDPISGIDIAVKGTGLIARTDYEGKFVLGSLTAGDYTLVAWLPDGKFEEKVISVPSQKGNYDIIV